MKSILLAFLLTASLSTSFSQAQDINDLVGIDAGGAYTRFAQPGDITIQVSVWGNTHAGIWEVTQGLHLSTLFTLAGGPQSNQGSSNLNQIGPGSGRIVRTVTLRLLRKQQDDYVVVFEDVMKDRLSPLKEDPVLQDGDLVLVESQVRRTLGWRDALTIIGSIGSTVFLIDRLVSFARGES